MKNMFGFQHLLSIKQLNREMINTILDTATHFLKGVLSNKTTSPDLEGKLIANLFFEPSTRTCNSFQVAAQRLNALTLTPNLQASSLLKGETLLDTVNCLGAIGVDTFIIRHNENGILAWLADHIKYECHIISAGEGWLQHPTQALLDLLTIQQYKSDWANLRVAIVGDLRHSRVARSLIDGLSIMGTKDIHLICPEILTPEADVYAKTQLFNQLEQGLVDADVIVCLRLQKERMLQEQLVNEVEFIKHYGITAEKVKFAKPDAIIMHPGPVNRGIEISAELADGPQSVILKQIQNGVAIRMAILKLFLTNESFN